MKKKVNFKGLDKSLKKQLIIDKAIEIFHNKGYRAATLDDVANELGLTRPALYHYVSSKENLLSEIYLQALSSFFDTIYEIAGMDLKPPKKLRLFIQRHLDTVVIQNLTMFTVFFSEENQLPKAEFDKIQKEKLKFTNVVETIISEGMKQGHFRKVNPRLYANAVIGMCNWLHTWYDPEKSSFSPKDIIDQYMCIIEGGLRLPEKEIKGQSPKSEPRDRTKVMDELKACLLKTNQLIEELEAFS